MHKDLIADLVDSSEDFMAMIHIAIPDGKIWSIPQAKESIEAEWTKVKEREEVKEMYNAMEEPVHFGNYHCFVRLMLSHSLAMRANSSSGKPVTLFATSSSRYATLVLSMFISSLRASKSSLLTAIAESYGH